jgi:hypothetical protein
MLVPLDVPARRWARRARTSRETGGARSSAFLARLFVFNHCASMVESPLLRRFFMAMLQSAVKAGSGKEGRGRRTGFGSPAARDGPCKVFVTRSSSCLLLFTMA